MGTLYEWMNWDTCRFFFIILGFGFSRQEERWMDGCDAMGRGWDGEKGMKNEREEEQMRRMGLIDEEDERMDKSYDDVDVDDDDGTQKGKCTIARRACAIHGRG